ncbi:MAG TPA: glycoside hydrolase family 38 C-terminal domain-containing protein [Planctomycetota bacterium]|nr:glycoside hydrolase family 38 C-terminal domain-containing protein [Planctomycetota bacterium]
MARRGILAALVGSLALDWTASAQQAAAPAKPAAKPTLYYVSHTHWEGAVFFTREEYLAIGLPHIVAALRMLEKYPDYHFTLDQVAYVRPFLERYPEQGDAFRRFVKEGRLHIVGGMDVMPDDVKPGGETFVRQMAYGKRWCRDALGVDVKVAWLLDTFGHHPQLPQLLAGAGFDSFWFCRGVPQDDLPSEFLWQGIDGTKIPAFWIPGFYGLFYGPPRDDAGFASFFQQRFDALTSHVHGPERVGLAGVDVCPPEEDLTPLIHRFNARSDAPFEIRQAGPEEFAAVVAKRSDRPTFSFDLNPIFLGTYSNRIELHQERRALESLLLRAESLAATAAQLGTPPRDGDFERAWEPLLFNQTHDLASGVMTDPVYDDTRRSDAFVRRLGEELGDDAFARVAERIDTRGDGVPVVVWNECSWPRSDVVTVDVAAPPGAASMEVVDADGRALATQLDGVVRLADGALAQARVSFLAHDVPPLGWATFHVRAVAPEPGAESGAAPPSPDSDDEVLENEFFRVVVDRTTGALTSLREHGSDRELLAAPGNVVARSPDDGDSWEIGRPLDGGMYIASKERRPVPSVATALMSSMLNGKPASIARGAVFSELRVADHYGGGEFATRIRVAAGVPRVDVETTLVNREKHVRYQALFPTTIAAGRRIDEIPFGSLERPAGVEFPVQHWIDWSDERGGVALLNRGLPGNVVTDGVVMVSLLRAVDLRGYNEGRSSETGFELNVPRTLAYSVVPHPADVRRSDLVRRGLELNRPLLARKFAAHAGSLPARRSGLDVSSPDVVVTAFKPGKDGTTILRLYESSGLPAPHVTLRFAAKITDAARADLLEDATAPLSPDGATLTLDLRPFEIATLRVRLAPFAH